MTIADWLMISAVLSGPIIAVQLTRFLDAAKEERERKLQVFKTLMATRAYTVSWDHVVALNRIDLELKSSILRTERRKSFDHFLPNFVHVTGSVGCAEQVFERVLLYESGVDNENQFSVSRIVPSAQLNFPS